MYNVQYYYGEHLCIAPAFHLTNILISQDEAKVMVISNSYVKLHYYWILWKLHV